MNATPEAPVSAPPTAETVGEYARRWWQDVRSGELGSLPIIVGLIIIAIVFQTQNDRYLTSGNFVNLIVQSAPFAILAMGVVFVLLLGEIDLSIGFVSGVGGVLTAVLLLPDGNELAVGLVIPLVLLAGLAIGVLHGLIITKIGVPSFVVTLAGLLAWNGVVLLLIGSRGTVILQDDFTIGLANDFLAPATAWILALGAVAAYAAVQLNEVRVRRKAGLASDPLLLYGLRIAVVAVLLAVVVAVANDDRGVPWVGVLVGSPVHGLVVRPAPYAFRQPHIRRRRQRRGRAPRGHQRRQRAHRRVRDLLVHGGARRHRAGLAAALGGHQLRRRHAAALLDRRGGDRRHQPVRRARPRARARCSARSSSARSTTASGCSGSDRARSSLSPAAFCCWRSRSTRSPVAGCSSPDDCDARARGQGRSRHRRQPRDRRGGGPGAARSRRPGGAALAQRGRPGPGRRAGRGLRRERPGAVQRGVDEVVERFGRLDVAVANAGVGAYGSFLELDQEQLELMIDVNLKGTLYTARAALPHLIEAGESDFVALASEAGRRGLPNEAVYCASKFGQVGFVRSLDHEMREHGVRCTNVCPGGVATDFAIGTGRTRDMPELDGHDEPRRRGRGRHVRDHAPARAPRARDRAAADERGVVGVAWGVLSTARINRPVLEAARESELVDVVAVASRDPARAQAYAAEHGIPVAHGSYEALLEDPGVEAVYISLPNSMHVEWSIRALEAGKHVLCEKPLAARAADAERAFARRGERGPAALARPSCTATTRRPAGWRSWSAEGAVGEPRAVRASFSFRLDDPQNVRMLRELDGGSLMDVGCYCVSGTRLVAGAEPERVFGEAVERGGVDVRFSGSLRFPGPLLATLRLRLRHPARPRPRGDRRRRVAVPRRPVARSRARHRAAPGGRERADPGRARELLPARARRHERRRSAPGAPRCSAATTPSARRAPSRRCCARPSRGRPSRSDDAGRDHRLRAGR